MSLNTKMFSLFVGIGLVFFSGMALGMRDLKKGPGLIDLSIVLVFYIGGMGINYIARTPLRPGERDIFMEDFWGSSSTKPAEVKASSETSIPPKPAEVTSPSSHGTQFLIWLAASCGGLVFTLLSAYLMKRFGWN